MKKLMILLAVLLALVSPAASMAEEAADTGSEWLYEEDVDAGENWSEATDEDAEASLEEDEVSEDEDFFLSALEVYGWFEAQPLDVDPDKPSPDGKKYQVLDERLNTLQALDAEVRTYFSDSIANKLLGSGVYEEIDGYLYTAAQDRFIDENLGETELNVESRTDDKITYTLTITRVDEAGNVTSTENLTYVREKIDGAWKFTQFPYFL
jgi:hypothetical protein